MQNRTSIHIRCKRSFQLDIPLTHIHSMRRKPSTYNNRFGRIDIYRIIIQIRQRQIHIKVIPTIRYVGGHVGRIWFGFIPVIWVKDFDLILSEIGVGGFGDFVYIVCVWVATGDDDAAVGEEGGGGVIHPGYGRGACLSPSGTGGLFGVKVPASSAWIPFLRGEAYQD